MFMAMYSSDIGNAYIHVLQPRKSPVRPVLPKVKQSPCASKRPHSLKAISCRRWRVCDVLPPIRILNDYDSHPRKPLTVLGTLSRRAPVGCGLASLHVHPHGRLEQKIPQLLKPFLREEVIDHHHAVPGIQVTGTADILGGSSLQALSH